MYALIIDGIVRELTDKDPAGRYVDSLHWVKCDKSVNCGDIYRDGVFSKPPKEEISAEEIRAIRDAKLMKTDKYLIADFPIDAVKLDAVKAYRKELRDVPKQEGFPHDVTWPVNPME